jgi:hypothetical protein
MVHGQVLEVAAERGDRTVGVHGVICKDHFTGQ